MFKIDCGEGYAIEIWHHGNCLVKLAISNDKGSSLIVALDKEELEALTSVLNVVTKYTKEWSN